MNDASDKPAEDIKPGWIRALLKGSRDYYPCILPPELGFAPDLLLKLFYRGIYVNEAQAEQIRVLRDRGIVVYTTKYKSDFEYLFYYTRCRELRLPVPEIGFDHRFLLLQPLLRLIRICVAQTEGFLRNFSFPDPYKTGYLREQLLGGSSALLPLIEKRGFYRRFIKSEADPIRFLIDLQKTSDRPVFLVPTAMFFSRKPSRSIPTMADIFFGPEERPKRTRRLFTLFKNPGDVFTEISEPVNLQETLSGSEFADLSTDEQARELRRQLILQTNRLRQSILGPVLKTREELKHSILTGERLQAFMKDHAKTKNIALHTVYRKANNYLEEIMAKYNMAIIRAGELGVRLIVHWMFEGVSYSQQEVEHVKATARKAPLVLIPCHKSHIDYLIISYILFKSHMPCPLIAAGKNLSFWPLGPFFRGGGAFFIRRTFRGAILYSKVFAEYIFRLLKEGFNLEFFIEGGRSRTGKLILPKLGLLSIILNAYKDGACEDLMLVPIFIGYDRVLEESAYLHELEGGQKEPENLRQVIRARKFLKKRYGRIYLNFHDPISLNEILNRMDLSLADVPSKDFNAFTRNLGHRIIHAINTVSVVTPYALVAAAILCWPKDRFSFEELMRTVRTFMTHLTTQQARLADTLLLDYERAVEQAVEAYLQRKFVDQVAGDREKGFADAVFEVSESRRPLLEYYKNSSIAFFVPAAYTALAIRELDAFQFSTVQLHGTYGFLQDLFKNEFAYDVDKSSETYIRKAIKAFIDDAIVSPHPTLPDRYNITSVGFRKLKLFSRFLKPYLESYWVVLNFFMDHPQNAIVAKDRIKRIQSLGNKMYKKREIELKESLSKVNYSNAVDYFIYRGVRGSESTEAIERYREAIERYRSIMAE
ncbi:MAG: 1-acyl-sn-glycerol-3-phosphate acyltransferase [Desulfobacterales bacterium]|jgi:glycerol-3-phosphate O-acyltransferase